MATCPKCGAVNEAAVNFCGDCGTPLQQPGTPAPPQPPAAAGWQATPAPSQYPPQPFPPQQYPPQQYPPQQFPPQQYPPQQGWQPAPPPKQGMGIGVKILLGVVGVVVVGFIGLIILGSLLPDDPPADDPTTPAATNTPTNTPPAQTNPPANNPPKTTENPLGVTFQPMAAQGTFPGAKIVAKGKADFSYQSYDRFGPDQILLARSGGTGVEAMVYEFRDGVLKPALAFTQPIGGIRDVAYGDVFNDGKLRGLIIGEKGLLVVDNDGGSDVVQTTTLAHMHVGDWDGDGKQETAYIHEQGGKTIAKVIRHTSDGKGDETLGEFEAVGYPINQATTYLTTNKRKLILGLEPTQPAGQLPVALFTLDPTKGFSKFASIPVKNTDKEMVISYSAGVIGDKASLVVSYTASPSYVEVFDLSGSNGMTSRGKLTLPDNGEYTVVLGYFTQKDKLEIAAFDSASGNYLIFGF